jgi:hypothetical protein
MTRTAISTVLFAILLAGTAGAETNRTHTAPGLGDYDLPFYPNAAYDAGVQSPDEFLGYTLGSRPTTHPDIISYFEYLAEKFSNAELRDYGETYEGRRLVYLVVTSEDNHDRMAAIRADLAKLADPRELEDGGEATRIVKENPAVAWMLYGIHGDELSSGEAALQLAYQLLAGEDEDSRLIMDEMIVCIDPCENPDGRTRWLQQLTQWGGVVPSRDIQSIAHRGVWPWGRMNHYLFDLNRDWFSTVNLESRGKTSAILDWMPHYLLDCHEMGPTDTYMFSPPREPFNPFMVDYIYKWWDRVAESHGRMFDQYGWSYYTREWNEEFFPGYGSSWGIYIGAVGMLFEQAGVDGSQVMRPEGTVLTYRETVHHQFIGSFANLLACANGREELLSDFYNVKLKNVRDRGKAGAFVFPPGPNASRLARFAGKLRHQRIEVETATSSFKLSRAVSSLADPVKDKTFPEGTLVVRTAQPLKQLVEVLLSFDIRIPTSFLEIEKKEILKHGRTKLYETTAWSMPLAYGLEAYYTESLPRVKTVPYTQPEVGGRLAEDEKASSIGFVFDGSDDRSYHLLVALLERGYKVWSSRKPFANKGRMFPRGSYQIRLNGNPDLDVEELADLAEQAGVEVFGIETSLGKEYADLGGGEFRLLERPRIAVLGNYPVSAYSAGVIWHLLDNRFELRTSMLDVGTTSRVDLDKYNVLILPNVWGEAMAYKRLLGKNGISKLKDWVEGGGTLIAVGNASAFLADSSVAMTAVKTQRQVLKKLAKYEAAIADREAAEAVVVDSLQLWEATEPQDESEELDDKSRIEYEALKAEDEKARKLYPRGAILRVELDDEHWLTNGCDAVVPVMFNTNYAYLAGGSAQVAGRLADEQKVRLAGLVWPEARERWGKTAWLTRERKGKGQVIMFATLPNFRGYFHGAERLLLNAMFLGPGLGTRRTIEW